MLLANLCAALDLPHSAAFFLHSSQGTTLTAHFKAGECFDLNVKHNPDL